MASESALKTITVSLLVTVISSVLVSGAVVTLKPLQEKNKTEEKKKNILIASGIYNAKEDIGKQFANFEPMLVDILSGEKAKENISTDNYDMQKILKSPDTSISLSPQQDVAGIRKVPRLMLVYFLKQGDTIENLILPIYGKGLWSTMYGYLVLESDLDTVKGVTFYEHGETPGLGGEIDNPRWKALWQGKRLFSPAGKYQFQVLKGSVTTNDPLQEYHVDGLSGATLTVRGVNHTIEFWLGQSGYGKFLQKLRSSAQTAVR